MAAANGRRPTPSAEAVLFVVDGSVRPHASATRCTLLEPGRVRLPAARRHVDAAQPAATTRARFHWIRKAYQRVEGLDVPPAFVTNERDVPPLPMPDTNGAWTTTRFVDPADLRHDMHVNIVNFEPGGAIPFPETHVMEHGLYVLEGKAVYLLNRDWVEVEAGDFMWLRAFCPQACYAGGPGRFRYLLYKDVNRHVPLSRQFCLILHDAEKAFRNPFLDGAAACTVDLARRLFGMDNQPAGCRPPTMPPPHAGVGNHGQSVVGQEYRMTVTEASDTSVASVIVNGQPRVARRRAHPHDGPGLPARSRAHRLQGGLRRGRVRRLLGPRRAARDSPARTEWIAINACLVPVAALDGQEVVTAEGLGTRGRAAPGAARDGGARRVAVRVLHAGVRLQHGGRVLPRGSRAVG